MASENILHNYVNWTYNFTLYSLTKAGYNAMQTAPSAHPSGIRSLIASGDRDEGNRSPRFDTVFFFDKFHFEAILGGRDAQNTNITTGEMTIIEPMGFTLFNRLIAEANDIGYESVAEMNYILKLDFFGYDMGGNPQKIDGTTKIFVVALRDMKMKISNRGSEYSCTVAPVPHETTFGKAAGNTPIKIESTASTVGEVFLCDTEATPPPSDLVTSVPKSHNSIKSFTGAINTWYKNHVADKKMTGTDEVVFEIHPAIAYSFLASDDEVAKASRHFDPAGKTKQDGIVTKGEPSKHPPQLMPFAEGTSITEAIGMVIRHSKFITDQLMDDERKQGAPPTGPMLWFKIIPRMLMKDYDATSNRYLKQYIYRIIPYEFHNVKNRSFPMSEGGDAVRVYNYIFTGKNKDIVNLDLQFDSAFYNALTTNQVNQEPGTGGKDRKRTEDPATKGASEAQAIVQADTRWWTGVNPSLAPREYPQSTSRGANAGLSNTSKGDKGRQLQDQISSSAELVNLNLKIVGDPDLIKQDDITFWNMQLGDEYTPTDSIVMDGGQVFVEINFNSAEDYDKNGLAIPGYGEYSLGALSGKFRIIKMTCEFANGKFFQNLELVRHELQVSKGVSGSSGGGGIDLLKSLEKAIVTEATQFDARDASTQGDVTDASADNSESMDVVSMTSFTRDN